MARPKKDPSERRTEQVTLALSPKEVTAIHEKAAKANTNVTAFVRAAALAKPVTVTQSQAVDFETRQELRRIGTNLNQIAKALNAEAERLKTDTLINCASVEYFTAVPPNTLRPRVITPQFLEEKPGGPKVISFYAKKARGAMARFIIQNRISDPDAMLDFDTGGYRYAPDLSSPGKPAFYRPAMAEA